MWNLNCHCLILPDVLLASQFLFVSIVFILFILIFLKKFLLMISDILPHSKSPHHFPFSLFTVLFLFRNETEKIKKYTKSHIFFFKKKKKRCFFLHFKETLQLLQRHCKKKKKIIHSPPYVSIYFLVLYAYFSCIVLIMLSLQLFLCHYI